MHPFHFSGEVGGGANAQELRDLKQENRQMLDRYQQMQKQATQRLLRFCVSASAGDGRCWFFDVFFSRKDDNLGV